jgi:diguanylate cyclase
LPDIGSIAKRPSLHDGTDPPIVLDRLLWVLSELAPEGESQDLTDFRTKLGEYRKGLAHTPAGPDLAAVAHSCLKTCEQYLERSRKYVAARDTELLELISILRRAAATIVGDTSDFSGQLIASTDKFQQLAQLNDLRELKRLLTAEASTLRTAVEAKRQRDEQTYTTLTSRVETLQSRLVKAEEEASLDPLTRVANRGTFDRALRQTVATSLDSGVPLSLAMVDIDDFKLANDQHGHPIGDRVLLCTALWLGRVVRRTDLVARYGGDEFAVILNDAKFQQVEARLNQALSDLAANSFEYDHDGEMRTIRFTASIGITELAAGDSPADLVKRADQALYDAKRKGKNRVVAKKRSMLANLLSRPPKTTKTA